MHRKVIQKHFPVSTSRGVKLTRAFLAPGIAFMLLCKSDVSYICLTFWPKKKIYKTFAELADTDFYFYPDLAEPT